ncbi:MAG: TonB-dependent receptor [Dechloromonas sp.]|nr:TonB-dependent receptor [Dechloromonas sp.]
MNPRLKPLAALLPAFFALSTQAAEQLAALDTVTVTATRQAAKVSEVLSDITVIEREEIEQAAQSTLEELLSRQPGIEVYSNGSFGGTTGLYIRGTNSKHALLLVDGMRIGSATSGDATWSRLPLNQIERVEILRGPASSLYGSDAIGGVIQIFTRDGKGPFTPYFEAGTGSFNTNSANAGFTGSQASWRYALDLARYDTEGFNSKRSTTGSDKDKDGYRNWSASGRIAYAFSRGNEAGISFLHSDGENEYDSGGDDKNRQKLTSFNTFLNNRLNDTWTSKLSFGHSEDDSVNKGTYNTSYKTFQKQYAWQNDLSTRLGNFLLGLERLEQRVESTTAYQQTSRTNDSAQLAWQGKFGNNRFQLSARRDDNSQFGSKNTGTVAYGYQFSPNWRANVSYGTAFRAPSFNDLYWPFADYGIYGTYQGNPNLKPEFARNREISVIYDRNGHNISLTWFLNKVENLIASSGGLNAMPVNVQNARLEGATVTYTGKLGSFDLQGNYSFLDPRNKDTDKILVRRASQYGTVSLGQRVGDFDWRIEVQGSGRRYDNTANTTKLAGYALTNLYGAYRFAADWSIFARVNNVFDRDYTLAGGYATPGANAFIGIRYSPK